MALTIREQIQAEVQRGASMPEVVSRYAKQGFTNEDMDYELDYAKKNVERRKKEKATAPIGLPEAAGETTAVSPPEVARTEWHPVDKLAGVGQGLVEGVKEGFVDPRNLVPLLAKAIGVKGWKSEATPLQKAAQEETKRREKLVAEKPLIERLGQDVGNVVSAIPAMAQAVAGPDVIPPGEDAATVSREAGRTFGKAAPKAVGASLVSAVEDPWTYVQAEPLSAAMDFLPVAGAVTKGLKAGALATKIPAVVKTIEKAGDLASDALKVPGKAITWAVDQPQELAIAAAERMGLDKTGDWLKQGNLVTRTQRFLSDPHAHTDERVRSFTQDLAMEPRRVEGAIAKRGESISETAATKAVADDFPLPPETDVTFGKVTTKQGGQETINQMDSLKRSIANDTDQLNGKRVVLRDEDAKAVSGRSKADRDQAARAAEQSRASIAKLEQAITNKQSKLDDLVAKPDVEDIGMSPKVDRLEGVNTKNPQGQLSDLEWERKSAFPEQLPAIDAKIARVERFIREQETGPVNTRHNVSSFQSPYAQDVAQEVAKAKGTPWTGGPIDEPGGHIAIATAVRNELGKLASDPLTIRELIRDEKFRKVFQKEANLSDAQVKKLMTDITDPTSIGLGPEYQNAFETALMESSKKTIPQRASRAVASVASKVVGPVAPETAAALKAYSASDVVRKRVVASTVQTLAEDAAKATKKKMLDGEANRLVPVQPGSTVSQVWSPESAARKYAKDLANGDMPVQALTQGQNPTALARALEATGDKNLVKEARRLRRFKQLDQELVGTDHWVDPLLYEALTAEANAQKFMKGGSAWATLASKMKANLTARNPKSALNNMISNSIMQVIRRGDPMGGIGEMISAFRNRASNPEKWAALDRTGVFEATALKQEMSVGKSLPHNKLMEDFYQSGDKWFKSGEAHRAFDELDGALKDLKPGQHVEIQIAPGRTVKVEYRGARNTNERFGFDNPQQVDHYLVHDTTGKKHYVDFGSKEYNDLIAKAAANRANQMFFDYGDVTGLTKFIRSQPALGILSPFFTYATKAIDLPGKAGLGTRIVQGSQGWIGSNSPKVLRNQAVAQALEGVRRSVIMHASKQGLLDKSNEDLVRAVQYMPNDMKPQFILGMSSPSHLAIASMGNWNAFDQTLTAARLASQLLVDKGALDPARAKEDPKAARLLYLSETGQLASAADALALIGLGGSAITDLLAKVQDADKPGGKGVTMASLVQSFGPAVLGGGADTIRDLSVGYLDEDSPYTSRYSGTSTKDQNVTEDFTRWAIRKTTGMGWKALNISDKRGFEALGKRWKESLNLPGRKVKAEKMINDGEATGDMKKQDEGWLEISNVKNLSRVVDQEMDTYYMDWLETADAVKNAGK